MEPLGRCPGGFHLYDDIWVPHSCCFRSYCSVGNKQQATPSLDVVDLAAACYRDWLLCLQPILVLGRVNYEGSKDRRNRLREFAGLCAA